MKTILDIKNNYAQEQGYEDWHELYMLTYSIMTFQMHMNEICIRAQKLALENAVHLGTMIVAENTLFKVVKKYNDFVWRLKSENGEIVNVFYALSQRWSLHCT